MKILLACYHTSVLRKCIQNNGHDVVSVDLKPSPGSSPGKHHQCDILTFLEHTEERFDMMLAFPPCTYLAKAQMWRCQKDASRAALRDKAVEFIYLLSRAYIPKISIENPIGYLSGHMGQPTQIVFPWWFGDPYKKDVCLWLKGLPPLIATQYNPVRKSISNHVNGRMSQVMKSEIKSSWDWYPGMCKAIADQWCPKIMGQSLDKGSYTFSRNLTLDRG